MGNMNERVAGLSEYSDEDLLKEIKHRGLKIEVQDFYVGRVNDGVRYLAGKIKIGGMLFDI